jgi:hypothetical protein
MQLLTLKIFIASEPLFAPAISASICSKQDAIRAVLTPQTCCESQTTFFSLDPPFAESSSFDKFCINILNTLQFSWITVQHHKNARSRFNHKQYLKLLLWYTIFNIKIKKGFHVKQNDNKGDCSVYRWDDVL